ncbi:hypothetical protein BH23BAC3_BH23BAC3_13050 [soil metagenome]
MAKKLIHTDSDIMSGEPVFYGTRVPVRSLFDWLETETLDDFLINFPSVKKNQALDVLRKAEKLITDRQHLNESTS